MIQRDGSTLQFVCDGCGDESDAYDGADFQRAVDDVRRLEGWHIAPDGRGGWAHNCGCEPRNRRLDAAREMFGR